MLRLVRQGVVDLIGAARPSIADPFLPNKIAEGREDDIRECIGCNICYSGDQTGTPIRCTQNPTMGEEWRKGWHPEVIPARGSNSNIVIVGGGPAGLEAAVALGRRGYDVVLAEARRELGGRVTLESNLPGMAEYARVRDWRLTQLDKLPNVEWYLESVVDRDQLHEFGADRIIVATGATWRHDGTGRWLEDPVPGWNRDSVITPDDVMAGFVPDGPVVVFDDDHYYMGGVIAERLRESGHPVTLITPANAVATWTSHTEEQFRIQQQLLLRGIDIRTAVSLTEVVAGEAVAECIYTGRREHIAANHVVMVTSRRPNDTLYQSLEPHVKANRIGDCAAPGHNRHRRLFRPSRRQGDGCQSRRSGQFRARTRHSPGQASMNRPVRVHPSLTESRLSVYWTDTAASPHQAPRLSTSADADLVIVGGGYTGLWCAIQALEDEPGRRVTVLEADSCGDGASSRNGGFCHASLTHGLENGLRHWPNEIETLTALGRANLDGVEETLVRHGIDASFERTGELVVATEPWQLAGLERGSEIADRFGYTSTVLHSAEVRRLLDSPTYLGGLVVPEDVAMVDPARLCWGLRHIAENLGATIHEGSRVSRLERSGKGLVLTTAEASVRCDKVIVATNAYRSPVRRARKYSIPVYDHVLMTEPLSSGQMASIGWQGRQGLGDSGQQFHYYRLTDDNRILWGGYDATYHWSSRIDPSLDDRRKHTTSWHTTSSRRFPSSRDSPSLTDGADQSPRRLASLPRGASAREAMLHGWGATPASESAPQGSVQEWRSTSSTVATLSEPHCRWCRSLRFPSLPNRFDRSACQ